MEQSELKRTGVERTSRETNSNGMLHHAAEVENAAAHLQDNRRSVPMDDVSIRKAPRKALRQESELLHLRFDIAEAARILKC